MFKIDFDIFMDILEKIKLDTNKPTPTIHYSEDEDKFVLYLKGMDFWKIYTMIIKKDIIAFGETTGLTPSDTLTEFRLNYLVHAVPIKEEAFLNRPEYIIKPKSKKVELKKDVEPGDDIINESKSYDDFIVLNFKKWEERALAAIEKLDFSKNLLEGQKLTEEDISEYKLDFNEFLEGNHNLINKTFGEFLQVLFNGINSLAFQRGSRKFITESMKEGLKEAENDTNVDIGISETFSNKVHALAEQELNGYTIHGKKWHGMKGVTHELRNDILNSIRDGVVNKESRGQLKKRVKDLFSIAKDSQAERIARTEVNRFIAEGKLQGFKDSGVDGRKTWLIVDDNDTSPVCKRLGKTYGEKGIPFDEPFRDEKTGKEYMIPPALPYCRSIIGFSLPEKEE